MQNVMTLEDVWFFNFSFPTLSFSFSAAYNTNVQNMFLWFMIRLNYVSAPSYTVNFYYELEHFPAIVFPALKLDLSL